MSDAYLPYANTTPPRLRHRHHGLHNIFTVITPYCLLPPTPLANIFVAIFPYSLSPPTPLPEHHCAREAVPGGRLLASPGTHSMSSWSNTESLTLYLRYTPPSGVRSAATSSASGCRSSSAASKACTQQWPIRFWGGSMRTQQFEHFIP